jgi:hypothetical protein
MHKALESLVEMLLEADPESGRDLIRAYLMQELFQFLGRTQCLFKTAILPIAKLPITTCMMTIAPSGSGKSRVNTTLGYIFGEYHKAFKAEIKHKKEAFNDDVDAQALVKFGSGDNKTTKREAWAKANYILGFVSMNNQVGTTQGVAHAVSAMQDLKIGSYCHKIDECASVIVSNNQNTKDFLDALLEFTGGATNLSRTLKGEVIELDATGIAFNVHFFGNSEHLEDDKNLAIFRTFLRRGFSRRNFYTYIPERIEAKREWLDIVPDFEKFKKVSSFFHKKFFELLNQENKTFTFSDDAKCFLKDYKIGNQKPTGNVDADNEKIDHVFKAQKLACVLAFLDRSFLIEKHHCESAIWYVRTSADAYLALLGSIQKSVQSKTDTYPSQIVETLIKEGQLSKRNLERKLTPVPRNVSPEKWDLFIKDASQFAEEEGFFLIKEKTPNGVGFQYRLESMQETTDAMISYSVKAPDVPEEPKRCLATNYEVEHSTLEDYAVISSFLHTSPAVFKGGHRKAENVEYLGNIAVFDIDNSDSSFDAMFTVDDAIARLDGYQSVVIETLSSTKEHPRFRVVVVLDKPVKGLSAETYKNMLLNIAKHLGIDGVIDHSCREPARYYSQTMREGGGITYGAMYAKPLEWERFLTASVDVPRPVIYNKVDFEFSEDELKRRYQKAVKTTIKKHWRVGERNKIAYYLAKRGKEAGFSDPEIEALIHQESAKEGMPLDTKETKAVVTNAGRY